MLVCDNIGGVNFLFFFFQAEDGIRDYKVTGVQTCALPIYGSTLYTQNAKTSFHTYQDSGVFHVTLSVGDVLGVSHTITKDITVLNLPPSVDIDPGKTLVWGQSWTSVPRITDQSPIDRTSLQGQWIF